MLSNSNFIDKQIVLVKVPELEDICLRAISAADNRTEITKQIAAEDLAENSG